MGHIVNPDKQYRLLQQRLDRNPTGAPDDPALVKGAKATTGGFKDLLE